MNRDLDQDCSIIPALGHHILGAGLAISAAVHWIQILDRAAAVRCDVRHGTDTASVRFQACIADAKTDSYGKKSTEEEEEFIGKWLKLSKQQQEELLVELEQDMLKAATNMEFERAAEIRDRIDTVQGDYLSLAKKDFAAKLGKQK